MARGGLFVKLASSKREGCSKVGFALAQTDEAEDHDCWTVQPNTRPASRGI
jgi:hypothetical protein